MFHKGQVGMYQVGSKTLGQLLGADDIEKAAVGWDVFKIVKLADLKASHSPLCRLHHLDGLRLCSAWVDCNAALSLLCIDEVMMETLQRLLWDKMPLGLQTWLTSS